MTEVIFKTPEAVRAIADSLVPQSFASAKFFSVLLFVRGCEIGLEDEDAGRWICVRTLHFGNAGDALDAYSNIPCAASQLLEASTEEELLEKEEQMKRNYRDEAWLEENLYPYL